MPTLLVGALAAMVWRNRVGGVLAFTSFPLLGDVGTGPKYAHNIAMRGIVLLRAGAFAATCRNPRGG